MTAGHEDMGRGMMRGSKTPWAQGPANFRMKSGIVLPAWAGSMILKLMDSSSEAPKSGTVAKVLVFKAFLKDSMVLIFECNSEKCFLLRAGSMILKLLGQGLHIRIYSCHKPLPPTRRRVDEGVWALLFEISNRNFVFRMTEFIGLPRHL